MICRKKINQSLVWDEHQARVDCELRGGDVSEHWSSIISSQYEELVSKVEALTEINRLQSEENKQLAEDNAKLREVLSYVTERFEGYLTDKYYMSRDSLYDEGFACQSLIEANELLESMK